MSENQAPDIPIRWVLMTPELADHFLEHNSHNRNLRYRKVDAMVADMLAGHWEPEAADPIKRSKDLMLLDGQHRLHAVVKSGVSVWMPVAENVPVRAQTVMDSGTPRRYADQLSLQGRSHVRSFAAVLRWIHLWELQKYTTANSRSLVTNKQLEATLEAHPEVEDSVEFANVAARKLRISPSVFGMAHWLFSPIDKFQANEFLSRVADGLELSGDHPAYAFRERASRDRTTDRNVTPEMRLALLIMSWNAYREGRTMTKLQLPSGGLTDGNYPMPR